MAGTHPMPEWHSDDTGIVRMVDSAGRPQRYEMKRLVPFGDHTFVILEPTKEGEPLLVGEYALGWNGEAWVTPIPAGPLTFVIVSLAIARDREPRTNRYHGYHA